MNVRIERAGRLRLAATGLGLLIIILVATSLGAGPAWFAAVSPEGQIGVETVAANAELFVALVLFLFPTGERAERMSWLAGGFMVLGIGTYIFGCLLPLQGITVDLNTVMYETFVVCTTSSVLFAAALLPQTPW